MRKAVKEMFDLMRRHGYDLVLAARVYQENGEWFLDWDIVSIFDKEGDAAVLEEVIRGLKNNSRGVKDV